MAEKERKRIINELKRIYVPKGWAKDKFLQFKEHDFESYYPERFSAEVREITNLKDKNEKRERKIFLVEKVKKWIIDK